MLDLFKFLVVFLGLEGELFPLTINFMRVDSSGS